MTLVSLPSPIVWPGIGGYSTGNVPFLTNMSTLSSVGHYFAYVLVAKEDMVISHVGVKCSTSAGSPTLTASIETVDVSTGLPAGSAGFGSTNGTSGTVTTGSYVQIALGGAATVSKGSVFAVKIALASGTSQIIHAWTGSSFGWQLRGNFPYLVTNTGTPTKAEWRDQAATFSLGSSSTSFYQIPNFIPGTTSSQGTFNNTSSARRGLRFTPPMKCRAIGIRWLSAGSAGDYNIAIYSDAGSELSSSSTAFDGDFTTASSAGTYNYAFFDNAVTLDAGTTYRAAVEPTSATNVQVSTITLPSVDYRTATPAGTTAHYTTYVASSWTDTATDLIPLMDVIIDQVDDGSGSGGGGVIGVIGG